MNLHEIDVSKSTIINLPPTIFLKLALPFGHANGPTADLKKVEKYATLPKWDTMPMLSIKQLDSGKFQVGIHDGRHRAMAAVKQQKATIPVEIVCGRKFARENPTVSADDLLQKIIEAGGNLTSEDGQHQVSISAYIS